MPNIATQINKDLQFRIPESPDRNDDWIHSYNVKLYNYVGLNPVKRTEPCTHRCVATCKCACVIKFILHAFLACLGNTCFNCIVLIAVGQLIIHIAMICHRYIHIQICLF